MEERSCGSQKDFLVPSFGSRVCSPQCAVAADCAFLHVVLLVFVRPRTEQGLCLSALWVLGNSSCFLLVLLLGRCILQPISHDHEAPACAGSQ